MDKPKGFTVVQRIAEMLLGLGVSSPFFAGVAIGFVLAVCVFFAVDKDTPNLFDGYGARVDAAIECTQAGLGNAYCLELIRGK